MKYPTNISKNIFSKSLILVFLSTFLITACGSSSEFDSGPQVRIVSPSDDLVFAAGSRVTLELTTENFVLGPPSDFNAADDGAASQGAATHAGRLAQVAGSGDGHYHLYLDDAVASDPHVTAWTDIVDYDLPADISAGTHSFRLELRDNDHQIVGVEDVIFFTIEN